jgi:leader peptidase (prepilin peptidase)/N-methyltransferase
MVALILATVAALGVQDGTALGWTCALLVPLTALALVDAVTRRLPDILTLAVLALGLARLATAGQPWVMPGMLALVWFAVGLLVDRLAPDGPIGAGDFLLLGAASVWLGIAALLELGLLTALLVWAHYLGLWLTGRATDGVPLAPSMALSLLALWLAAPG